MKQLSIITNLALFIFLSACDKNDTADSDGNSSGSSHADGARQEEIANKIMDSMGEFAKAISAVSDTKTARSTATKINGIGDQFSSMAKELEPLEVATEEMRESIHQKMAAREAEMKEVMNEKFMKSVQSLNPEAQKIMEKAFQDFFEVMEQAGKEFDRHFKVKN
jgi:phage-related protein